jgi:hypothetical protein
MPKNLRIPDMSSGIFISTIAFTLSIKHELASSGTLNHYDPNKKALFQRMHHHLVLAQLLGRNEAKI